MSIQRILVIDDDNLSREFLTEAVRDLGYQPLSAPSAQDGLALIEAEEGRVDLVITDLRMPGMDGHELVAELSKRYPGLPSVLVTAHGTVDSAVRAMRDGACDFLLKPCSPDALDLVIQRIERTQRLTEENRYLRDEVVGHEDLIASSPAMMDLLRSTGRIARSKGTVLITGESGTGKERIAQHIHRNSPRADGPFIRVNCAALSEQLLESELFGHEKGSFTGAHRTRIGRFELADGGTILLDEVGEISPNMQAKLLRVLQEEEFERVGGQSTIRVDARIIAATNRDLVEEVAAGRFREDLYYRLHVLPLHVPSLRERRDDIIPLASHFAQRYARQNGDKSPLITDEACTKLHSWSWPGNVRELENVIQRAVILGRAGILAPEDLVFGPTTQSGEVETCMPGDLDLEGDTMAKALASKQLADVERVTILATLRETRGNKTEAARRLGVTARTLSNKMKIWRQAGLVA